MIEKILNAKHWQIFFLTFGIPMIFQILSIGSLITNLTFKTNFYAGSTILIDFLDYIPFFIIIFALIYFCWFWSVATGLQFLVPGHIKLNVSLFKTFFIIPMIYFMLFITYICFSINGIDEFNPASHLCLSFSLIAIIFPLHLFAMFCIFYILYFTAKTFKTVELQREVLFSDFAGEFLLLWFFPVGIWIVQPKINLMAEELSM